MFGEQVRLNLWSCRGSLPPGTLVHGRSGTSSSSHRRKTDDYMQCLVSTHMVCDVMLCVCAREYPACPGKCKNCGHLFQDLSQTAFCFDLAELQITDLYHRCLTEAEQTMMSVSCPAPKLLCNGTHLSVVSGRLSSLAAMLIARLQALVDLVAVVDGLGGRTSRLGAMVTTQSAAPVACSSALQACLDCSRYAALIKRSMFGCASQHASCSYRLVLQRSFQPCALCSQAACDHPAEACAAAIW